MPARPKNQHYVTRAYLDGFLNPGEELLLCYGRHRNQPFHGRPDVLARERSYYSFRQPDGKWDDSLEHEIERQVEAPGLQAIRKLSSGKVRLNWAERDAVAMLMAMQRFRVPHLRQLTDASYGEMTRRLLAEYDRRRREEGPGRLWFRVVRLGGQLGDRKDSGTFISREFLEETLRSLEEDPAQFSRETLFSLASEFAKCFRRMKWTIHYSTHQHPFITSDCPVLLRHDRLDVAHAGISRPDTRIEFPLTSTRLLSMTHDFPLIHRLKGLRPGKEALRLLQRTPEIRIARPTEESVREFNLRQAEYCSRWTFCARRNDWLIDVLQRRSKNVRQRLTRRGDLFVLESLAG